MSRRLLKCTGKCLASSLPLQYVNMDATQVISLAPNETRGIVRSLTEARQLWYGNLSCRCARCGNGSLRPNSHHHGTFSETYLWGSPTFPQPSIDEQPTSRMATEKENESGKTPVPIHPGSQRKVVPFHSIYSPTSTLFWEMKREKM